MPKAAKGQSTSTSRYFAAPYTTTISLSPISGAASSTDRRTSTRQNRIMSSPDSTAHPSRTNNSAWTSASDRQLMEARTKGMNWTTIAHQYFGVKTPNACRKRHERLMAQRRDSQDWEGVKLEQLAKTYIEMREQMWKILANRLGEEWQIVEKKCMEKGLKNLQVASRTVTRREKAASVATPSHYSESPGTNNDPEGDSGLGQDITNTPSNNGDDHPSHTNNHQAPQDNSPAFPFSQPRPVAQPNPHRNHVSQNQQSLSHSSGSGHHERGISYPISSSSAASSSTTSPTFTVPSDRTWSFPSNYPAPPSTLLQAYSPPPQPVQPPTMNHSGTGGRSGYGFAPTTTGTGLPNIASILGKPMGEPAVVTTT